MPIGATKLAPASTERIYLKLAVYNYDADPRGQIIEHNCSSIAAAKRAKDRLQKLIGMRLPDNKTGNFLERNYRVYGFIEQVGGIYREVTTRIE